MSSTPIPSTPLQRIGITMSGGGYRAAAFHLGSLDYLQRTPFQNEPLLHKIRIMSTVSGGTICGALYAVMLKRGKSFDDFFYKLWDFMRDQDLVENGLDLLVHDKDWPEHKRRNLINAFARIYDRDLYEGAQFDLFMDLSKDDVHLDEVIFNATEFRNGLYFRFQNEGRCGNKYLYLTQAEMKELKIGDIAAASSCFPSGFEPLAFPHDFLHDNTPNLTTKCKYEDFQSGPVGLMDGGIIDNQGIFSVLLAENRKRDRLVETIHDRITERGLEEPVPTEEINEKQLDLMFVSDVSSPYMEQLAFAKPQPSKFLQKLNISWFATIRKRVNLIFSILVGLLIFFTLALVVAMIGPDWLPFPNYIMLVSAVLFGLILVPVIAYSWLKRRIQKEINKAHQGRKGYDPNVNYGLTDFIPGFYQKYVPFFASLNFGVLKPMGEDRLNSVLSMVSDVFMKQVRRLIYDRLYLDPGWEHRRLANFIYELRAQDLGKRHDINKLDQELQEVGERITAAAEKATSMGTTLWFSEEEKENGMIEHLIACGQFAACYNLLEYLCLLRQAPDYPTRLDQKQRDELDSLWNVMIQDWRRFRNDPFFLLKEREAKKERATEKLAPTQV